MTRRSKEPELTESKSVVTEPGPEAPLEVHQDPAPPAVAPDQPPEPAPESAAPAPEGAPDLAAPPTIPPDELAGLAGELYVSAVEFIISRRWPGQPLTEDERAKLASSGGRLLAYYLPETLSPVTLLWVNAGVPLLFVLGSRMTAERAAKNQPEKTAEVPPVAASSPTGPATVP